MNSKKFSEAMSEIDNKYINEVILYKKRTKKFSWLKWGVIAACFVVAILGIDLFKKVLFDSNIDIAILHNGDKIKFIQSDTVSSLSLDIDVTTRQLTKEEVYTLFGDLPVTANAIFLTNRNNNNIQNLVGFDGKIGNVKMIIATSDIQLLDTMIIGNEENTKVYNTNVTAGYFITKPNSKGEQNIIYYATFKLGNNSIYLENAGTKKERERVKNDLVNVIQELINKGALNLSSFIE